MNAQKGGNGTGGGASTTGSGRGNAQGNTAASGWSGAAAESPGRAAPWRVRFRVPVSGVGKMPSPNDFRSRLRPTRGTGAAPSGVQSDREMGKALPGVEHDRETGVALPRVDARRGVRTALLGVAPPPRLPDRDATRSTPLPSAFFSRHRPLRGAGAAGGSPVTGVWVEGVIGVRVVGGVRLEGGEWVEGGLWFAIEAAALARVPNVDEPPRIPPLPRALRSRLMRLRRVEEGAGTRDVGTPWDAAGVGVGAGTTAVRPPSRNSCFLGSCVSLARRWLQYTPSSSVSSRTSSSSCPPALTGHWDRRWRGCSSDPLPDASAAPIVAEPSNRSGGKSGSVEPPATRGRRGHTGDRSHGRLAASRWASSSSHASRKYRPRGGSGLPASTATNSVPSPRLGDASGGVAAGGGGSVGAATRARLALRGGGGDSALALSGTPPSVHPGGEGARARRWPALPAPTVGGASAARSSAPMSEK